MAKVMHLYGLVRDASTAKKRSDGEVFGVKLNILTEPAGDTMVVTAFIDVMPESEGLALKGESVHAVVTVGVRPQSADVAYLDANLVSVEAWDPATVGSSV